ncbi:MAG: DUF4388 domain-containing protein [Pyrinomonadaceae bacterium]
MALTGHLSDLSLSELIEFFCNQRKSGSLRVLYPQGAGYFYLQSGSVVDARIGVARGIDAVYYALTLPNAKFEFSGSTDAPDRTINQPWTQVVLEGLRRLDEGITPADAFPAGYQSEKSDPDKVEVEKAPERINHLPVPAFLSFMGKESISKRKPFFAGAVLVAVLGSVAAVGVPAGWYSRTKVSAAASQSVAMPPITEPSVPAIAEASPAETEAVDTTTHSEDANAQTAKRQREKDRAKTREERPGALNRTTTASVPAPTSAPAPVASTGPKKVAVTVTYDESGRVIQASGGDASAIRIARQKRFPPGKAGSATVTIPIN